MAIVKYRVTGISPLLMDNPAGLLAPKSSGARTRHVPSPSEEAEAAAYRLPDGDLYFPALAFRRALIDGGTGRKIGTRGAISVIAGSVFLPDDAPLEVPLVDPDTDKPLREYEVDVQRAVLRANKAAVARARPRLNSWAADVAFDYQDDVYPRGPELLTEVFTLAGTAVGIGNYRPQKGGIFGRFRVELA